MLPVTVQGQMYWSVECLRCDTLPIFTSIPGQTFNGSELVSSDLDAASGPWRSPEMAMKLPTITRLIAVYSTLAVLALAAIVRPPDSSAIAKPVVDLTLNNFYQTAEGTWLVNYRNSDPECACWSHELESLWDDIVNEIRKEVAHVNLGQIDCAVGAEFRLCNKETVVYWAPQMRLSSNGRFTFGTITPPDLHKLGHLLLETDPAVRNATVQRNLTRKDSRARMAYQTAFSMTAAQLRAAYFDQTIAEGLWFVEYYSTHGFISYTKDFIPIWFKLAEEIKQRKIGVKLAKVNCAVNKDLCNANGVDAYPQLKLYRDGQFVETFEQPRELSVMRSYLEDHAMSYMDKQQTTLGVEEFVPESTLTFDFTLPEELPLALGEPSESV
ncbi:hypothetical protein NM688_g64 [Phlebia brevispora]|uniref:Uncharacterized protein n=1 Tax=Phlebia brevispora TaxID=194682 RepID=A0ACC1TFI3_9APHY|nr:hypothetical protein NM688_g64 [Phlebia brevispora]